MDKLDHDAFRSADEGQAQPRITRQRTDGNFGTLGAQLLHSGIQIINRQADVLEMGKGRPRGVGFVRVRRRDQNLLATEPHRDALLPGIERAERIDAAGNLGAEHRLKEAGCRVRVGAAEMDVIVLMLVIGLLCRLSLIRGRSAASLHRARNRHVSKFSIG